MQPSADRPSIAADNRGVHFLGVNNRDIIVAWGEIESINAVRCDSADGSTFIEVYVNHFSGVDFRFHSTEDGYSDTLTTMERHLIGFSASGVEGARGWEENLDRPPVWKRDEQVQPFQLEPPVTDNRPPTDAERQQMAAARQASIDTCERILGRTLRPDELGCVQVRFENARIVGHIASPLSGLITARSSSGDDV